jgi:hypothetical protein
MSIEINKLPLYWRVKNKPIEHNIISSTHKFELIYDEELKLFRQKIDENLTNILNKIYKENVNIGYIQESPIADMRYAAQFEEILSKYIVAKKVLEIGNGSHYFANKFFSSYRQFISVDPSCDPLISNKKHLHIKSKYPEAISSSEKFDLIFHYNFLEHCFDCMNVLKSNYNNLEFDGNLIFAVPDNTNSYKCGDIGFCMHEHIYYFTKNSLERILRIVGFSDIKFIQSEYGGSLLIIATKSRIIEKNYKINNINHEEELFLNKFERKISSLKKLVYQDYNHYVPLRAFPYLAYLDIDLDTLSFLDDKIGINNMYYDGCNSVIKNFDIKNKNPNFIIYSITFANNIAKKVRALNPSSNILFIENL